MKKNYLFLVGFVFLFIGSCNMNQVGFKNNEGCFSLVSWNVQTFFDAKKDGFEYADFLKSENWNVAMYEERVSRLCEVMQSLDADVYVLQEIENKSVLQDICNFLNCNVWKNTYLYSCFYKEENSSIGCAVISKFELSDLTTHTLDIRTSENIQPSLRPILSLTLNVGEKKIGLFVNHWKSKSGTKESDEWRKYQQALLVKQLSYVDSLSVDSVILCGDMNQDINEFENCEFNCEENQTFNVKLNGNILNEEDVLVYSPWIDSSGNYSTEIGSYYFQDNWERIDHIFVCGKIKIYSFEPCTDVNGKWTNEDKPYPYKVYSGKGYSDHLPIKASFLF